MTRSLSPNHFNTLMEDLLKDYVKSLCKYSSKHQVISKTDLIKSLGLISDCTYGKKLCARPFSRKAWLAFINLDVAVYDWLKSHLRSDLGYAKLL